MALQYGLTLLASRAPRFEGFIKATPRLLVSDGKLLREPMARERVTKAELLAAIREAGLARLEDARWVVLESDATLSVVARAEAGLRPTALSNVPGA